MGEERFYDYDGKSNNCQGFLNAVLNSNGLSTSESRDFIMQNTQEIFDDMPEYVHSIATGITDISAFSDWLLYGSGL